MQAVKTGYLHGSVTLVTELRGRPRATPVWELRYRLPSGKQSSKVLAKAWTKQSRPPQGFLTEAQARVAGQRFLDEHAETVPDDRKTFGRALADFLAYCVREKGRTPGTMHEYERIGQRLATRPWRGQETWRERPLDSFTDSELLALRTAMIDAGRSAQTINQCRRVLRGVFGVRPGSPILGWPFLAIRTQAKGRIQFYNPGQVARLIAATASDQDRAVYTLAAEAGPRQSEIRGLRVEAVDFDAGQIRIERAYTTRGKHGGTKSHEMRSVAMSDNVRAALWPLCAGKAGDALVFEHPDCPGQPMCGEMMYRHFKADAKRAGLPPITFHELRHSFGTEAMKIFTPHEVQVMMGHADIKTTMRYVHYVANPDAASKLSAAWNRSGAHAAPPNVVALRRAS